MRREIIRLTGEPTPAERAMEAASPGLYLVSLAARKLRILQQPGLLRTESRTGAPAPATRDVLRLQGGLATGSCRNLADRGRPGRAARRLRARAALVER